MSLRDQIETDVAAVFLNTDDFAESATYTPLGGVARSITITVSDDDSRRDDASHHTSDMRTIEVVVARDATTGITEPQRGDLLIVDSDPNVRWDFHSVIECRPAFYVLTYTSAKLLKAGQIRPQSL